MKRLETAQYIALGGTALSILGFCLGGLSGDQIGTLLLAAGCLLGFASYIFGGFGTAIKMSIKIATWGWIVVPFPYDILTFFLALMFSILAFFFLPIIPVRKAYKKKMNAEA